MSHRDSRNSKPARRRPGRRSTRELVERAAAPAWRWIHCFCRNRDDADDLAHDVLVALLRSLPKFRGESSLSTWTYVVARRACARRRMRERLAPLASEHAVRAACRNCGVRPMPAKLQRAVRRAVAGLAR